MVKIVAALVLFPIANEDAERGGIAAYILPDRFIGIQNERDQIRHIQNGPVDLYTSLAVCQH